MGQLTKRDLINLKEGVYIVEEIEQKETLLEVEKVVKGVTSVLHARDIVTDKVQKIFIGKNFSDEGDRKCKTDKGKLTAKYKLYVYTE